MMDICEKHTTGYCQNLPEGGIGIGPVQLGPPYITPPSYPIRNEHVPISIRYGTTVVDENGMIMVYDGMKFIRIPKATKLKD